ncbi:hypothetical protein [Aquihabitans sp. McL0605]|uniref:hypothetical protein n=1 Tax=Aquihabitans sp. McL0605 TaxID=3415671 RepID=UPI003CF0E38B
MTAPRRRPRLRWWQRSGPSILVFCVVLTVMALAAIVLWNSISDVVPVVGKDKQGEDPWQDPVGIEKVGGFQVVHIPDCAAAPVVRVALWDEKSKPYWEVSGPGIPMASFAIGATPQGFKVDTPYTAPPPGAVLRLAVVRSVKGVAGVRYTTSDLRTGYVAAGQPISRYLVEDFQTGNVCGDQIKATTTTTSVSSGG